MLIIREIFMRFSQKKTARLFAEKTCRAYGLSKIYKTYRNTACKDGN